MKRRIYLGITCLFVLFSPLYSQQKGNVTTLTSILLEEKNDTLFFEMDIHVPEDAPGTRQSLVLMPELVTLDGTHRYVLPFVGIEGKMREKLNRRKARFGKNSPETVSSFTYLLTDSLFSYRFVAPYELWMDDAILRVEEVVRGCAGTEERHLFPDLPALYVHSLIPYVPVPVVEFYEPVQEVKVRSVEKTAYVDFQVGKSLIVPGFKRNPEELAKIMETIGEVMDDKDITVTHLELTGYASPEGSYALNEKLSESRTLVLKNYIRDRSGLTDDMFRTNWIPEDWEGFEEQVLSSDLAEKERVLSIIRSDKAPDQKEADLKKLGAVYRTILNEMFPDLRRTTYRIGYTVRDYSVEEVAVLITKQPENLSPFEFYQIAKQSEKGSERWNELMLTTVRYNPDDVVSNLNAAAVLLASGEYEGARPYLEKASNDARVHMNLGVYYLLKGDPERAEEELLKVSVGDREVVAKNLLETSRLRHSKNRIERKGE